MSVADLEELLAVGADLVEHAHLLHASTSSREVRVRAGDRLLIAAGADAVQALQNNVMLGTVTQAPTRAFRRARG